MWAPSPLLAEFDPVWLAIWWRWFCTSGSKYLGGGGSTGRRQGRSSGDGQSLERLQLVFWRRRFLAKRASRYFGVRQDILLLTCAGGLSKINILADKSIGKQYGVGIKDGCTLMAASIEALESNPGSIDIAGIQRAGLVRVGLGWGSGWGSGIARAGFSHREESALPRTPLIIRTVDQKPTQLELS